MIYDNVKRICGQKGITISQMEKDLGFPRSSVCKWNDNEPGVTKVQKTADYLGTTIEELLTGESSVAAV